MTREKKLELIEQYRQHDQDTASPQVQVALLTERLSYLNSHFRENKKDHHSRRGLMKMVGHRRHLLDYLKRKDPGAYVTLIGSLGIRK